MGDMTDRLPRGAIRSALARAAYERDEVRIADADIAGHRWLVASSEGIFAVGMDSLKKVLFGRYFGICRAGDAIYAFERCGPHGTPDQRGRIVRIDRVGDRLAAAAVVAKGLDCQCHQLKIFDELIVVVDTANQAILRLTLDGRPVDVRRPFAPGKPGDTSGAYLHINAIERIGNAFAVMLHNGSAVPERRSELAWLDSDYVLRDRQPLAGHSCHDIVEDERGVLWHSASMSGEIMASDGRRALVTDAMMTRGIGLAPDAMIVGISTFGPRHVRDQLRGGLVVLDRDLRFLHEMEIRGAPTDIVQL